MPTSLLTSLLIGQRCPRLFRYDPTLLDDFSCTLDRQKFIEEAGTPPRRVPHFSRSLREVGTTNVYTVKLSKPKPSAQGVRFP
jgi:hypothetical protein